MTKEQERLVNETIDNYLAMDKMKSEVKDKIDAFFVYMADQLESNEMYKLFLDDPKGVMNEFILAFFQKNKDVIKDSVELGEDLGVKINAAA